ncbi:MAG: hypothetical protein HC855_08245 [Rhizobiales bacterium]|nr:hypothetical protein [Hyphomicrobiales bacterium]
MTHKLKTLLEAARRTSMSESEKEAQRRSFAYGSAKIENDDVTREMVDTAAERLRQKSYG